MRAVKETHPTTDLLGWFTTTNLPSLEPTPAQAAIHQQLMEYNESLTMLVMNPAPSASVGGGGKLPLAIYETLYDADEKDQSKLRLKFVPLKYTIETGEAEMIAVDFVAKGGFGNAGAVAASEDDQQNGAAKDKKGKGKAKETLETEEKVDAGTQNDEREPPPSLLV